MYATYSTMVIHSHAKQSMNTGKLLYLELVRTEENFEISDGWRKKYCDTKTFCIVPY